MESKNKKPLFVLHGGPALEKDYLSPWIQSLATQAELKTVDYPETPLFESIVSFVVEKIDREGGNSYSILCHSWGSSVFLAALPELKTRPEDVVFVTPFPLRLAEAASYFTAIRERLSKRLSPSEKSRLNEIDQNPDPLLDEEYARLVSPAYVHDLKNSSQVDFTSYRRKLAASIFASMGDFDFTKSLALLPKHSLLILGESDFLSAESAAPFQKNVSRSHTMANVGHSPFVEDPDNFLRMVSDLLRG